MSDDRPTDLLGALPRTRPHRRSEKRASRASEEQTETAATAPARTRQQGGSRPKATGQRAKPARASRPAKPARRPANRLPQPAQPEGTPTRAPARAQRSTARSGPVPVVKTAVQAAAELAEIGISLGTRALRGAVDRLPRP